MKPTQEQIDAALAYADFKETNAELRTIHEFAFDKTRQGFHNATKCNLILAAAYREKCKECDELQFKLQIKQEEIDGLDT